MTFLFELALQPADARGDDRGVGRRGEGLIRSRMGANAVAVMAGVIARDAQDGETEVVRKALSDEPPVEARSDGTVAEGLAPMGRSVAVGMLDGKETAVALTAAPACWSVVPQNLELDRKSLRALPTACGIPVRLVPNAVLCKVARALFHGARRPLGAARGQDLPAVVGHVLPVACLEARLADRVDPVGAGRSFVEVGTRLLQLATSAFTKRRHVRNHTRDEGQDCTVYAPTATAKVEA